MSEVNDLFIRCNDWIDELSAGFIEGEERPEIKDLRALLLIAQVAMIHIPKEETNV